MQPEQCPACGRPLSRDVVDEATTAPVPCPGCGTPVHLTAGDAPADPHPLDDWDVDSPAAQATAEVVALEPEQLGVVGAGAILGAVAVGRGRRLVGAVTGALVAFAAMLALRMRS